MVMSNHVMYDCGAWFLRVIMSSSRILCCLLSLKEQNMTSRFASLTKHDIKEIVEDKDSQNTKRLTKVAKKLFADYMKQKKVREHEVFSHV